MRICVGSWIVAARLVPVLVMFDWVVDCRVAIVDDIDVEERMSLPMTWAIKSR